MGLIQGAALVLFSVSRTGDLVYHPDYRATQIAELSWFGLDGEKLGTVPTESRVVYEMWSDRSGLSDLWLYDFQRDVPSRITFDALSEQSSLWSPDGRWISYSMHDNGRWTIYLKSNPPGQRKWQLTEERSLWHAWAPSGDRIYHQWSGSSLSSTDVDLSGGTPRMGQTAVALEGFPTPVSDLHGLAVRADGQAIFVLDSTGEVDTKPLRLAVNWRGMLAFPPNRRN